MLKTELINKNTIKLGKTLLKKLIFIVLFLLFASFAFWHFQVINNPFLNEFREGSVVLNTKLILEGGNPYDLANQPEYTNVYGIFYHFIVYPFAKIFGSTLKVHRAVTAFFILASCLLLFLAMRWLKVKTVLALSLVMIFYVHLLFYVIPLARPDSLGTFLFLCSILIPWRYQYSSFSLLLSTLLGILAFLTKPYFILALLYLNLYLFLFKSKSKGIKYGVIASVCLLFTVLGINNFFECYFNNVFFIHVNVATHELNYAIKQLATYAQYNWTIILILLWYYLISLGKTKILGSIKFNLSNFDKPLIKLNIDLIPFCLILSLLIFLFKLGQHQGNWLIYLHQLVSPFLLIVVSNILRVTQRINIVFLSLIILNIFTLSSSDFLPKLNYSFKEWHQITTLVSDYQQILNSPAITSVLLEQGKKVYDSGQSEFFVAGASRKGWLKFFPEDTKIKDRSNEFIADIAKSVTSKQYDLVILTSGYSPFVSEQLLQQYYQFQQSIPAPMTLARQPYQLDIWQPLSSKTVTTEPLQKSFGQQLTLLQPLKSCKAKETINIPIYVKNRSNFVWSSHVSNPVHLSYNWLDSNGTLVVKDSVRTKLPKRLVPEDSVTVNATIKFPDQAGSYTLVLTMVQEQVTWFNDAGVESTKITVQCK